MMAEGNDTRASGTPFLTLLSILFIALKLTGYVDWPWWVVLSPIWGQLALFAVVTVVVLIAYWWID